MKRKNRRKDRILRRKTKITKRKTKKHNRTNSSRPVPL